MPTLVTGPISEQAEYESHWNCVLSALTPVDLQQMALFRDLSLKSLEELLERHRETNHQAEQLIVMEQDWGESLFLLRSGLAKVRTFTADGDEVVMSLLGEGDVFGEMSALDGAARSADVVALTTLDLVKMRSAPFSALLQREVGFALALARLEASRLRDLNQRFALQSADATTRALDALAYLARKSSPKADATAEIPAVGQKEIALIAGLARETASRTISKLRSRGTIIDTKNGGLQLIDLKPLVKRGLLPIA